MNDVFLSYAREDRERAQRLAAALETRGWKVWWDKLIVAGKTFDEVIQQALDDTRSVVVLWSEVSTQSSWVKEEAAEGARRGILVPCLIDDVRIPLGFGRIQTASLIDWDGDADHPGWQELCAAIAASIEAATARATARLATVPKPADDDRPLTRGVPPLPDAASGVPWRRLRAPLLGVLAVAVVGAGYGAYIGREPGSDRPDPATAEGPAEVPAPPGEEPAVEARAASPEPEPAPAVEEPVGETPAEPAPWLVQVSGLTFSQAVEAAGGDHTVRRDSFSQCGFTSEGDDFVAWVKAGPTGSKCRFRLNADVGLLQGCRIVAWEIETPDPESFRWISAPHLGTDDPMLELRMWSDPFQGRRRLKLRQVHLSVPPDTPTFTAGGLELLDAPTLAERCLQAAPA